MKRKETVRVRWKVCTYRKKQGYRYVRNQRVYIADGKKYAHSEDRDSNDHTEEASQQAVNILKDTAVSGAIESVGVVRRGCTLKTKKRQGKEGDSRSQGVYSNLKVNMVQMLKCNIKNRFGYISTNYTNPLETIGLVGLKRQYIGGNKMSIWKWVVGVFSVMACICVTVMVFSGMLTASPFSLFFCDEVGEGAEMSLRQAMEIVEQEFIADAESKIEALEVDKVVIDTDDRSLNIVNWDEILAVFVVRNGIGNRIVMQQKGMDLFRETAFDMVELQYVKKEVKGNGSEEEITVAYVSMEYADVKNVGDQYGFTRWEIELVIRLLELIEEINCRQTCGGNFIANSVRK